MARTRARKRSDNAANDNASAGAAGAAQAEPPAPDPLFLEEMVDVFLGSARPVGGAAEDDPPFDPPDEADLAAIAEPDEEEPPFDPPDLDEPLMLSPPPGAAAELLLEPSNDNPEPPRHSRARARGEDAPLGQKLPALRIHASWDRPHIAALFASFAQDPRCSRALFSSDRGGLDAAIVRFSADEGPDLLLLDTTLRGAAMLAALDRLAAVLSPATKIIVLGAVNDVPLLRELAARGIAEYIVPPIGADELAALACRLYASVDKARVIAVIGARGGIGASTLAQNLAWSIAERQGVGATLVDLDLCFGAGAFSFNTPPSDAVAKIAAAAEDIDTLVDRLTAHPYPNLKLLTAPGALQQECELGVDALERVVAAVRRTSPYVVLDLPHLWRPWVREALVGADEVLIVAGPDLASLRNADNMCRLLREQRPSERAPMLVLSMTGMPRRPEIPAKEFAEALGAEPIAAFPFDPALFGACAMKGEMLAQAEPRSRAAAMIDGIASAITGREPIRLPQPKPTLPPAFEAAARAWEPANENAAAPADEAPLELVEPAPTPLDPATEQSTVARADAEADVQRRARAVGERPRRLLWAASVIVMLGAAGAWHVSARMAALTPMPAAASAATTQADSPDPMAPETASALYSEAIQSLETAPEIALESLRTLAQRGYPPAQYHLAKLYELGDHAPLDLVEARQWTERAAAAGNVRAMHDLGVYYARGEGAALDETAAFRWFRQAAEFDLADSQYNLGVFYEQGRGVAANQPEALFWFTLAARRGDADAAEHAAALAERLPPIAVEQARSRAQAFRPRTVDGFANAEPRSQQQTPHPEARAPATD